MIQFMLVHGCHLYVNFMFKHWSTYQYICITLRNISIYNVAHDIVLRGLLNISIHRDFE